MEVDHIFICTEYKASEAEMLKNFGLTEGTSNTHLGQGTANRRFFFKNFFLELLWLENVEEAKSETTAPTLLYDRISSKSDDISPFGVCFRPKNPEDKDVKFTSWSYKPSYLPNGLKVDVAKDSSLSEPMWFFLSFASRPDQASPDKAQPLTHSNGISEVTSIEITMPEFNEKFSLPDSKSLGMLNIINGNEHLLKITFDENKQGLSHDFRPTLPLVLKY
ncbi:hypothetical protein F895_02585 [Acinetobacter sp. CIP 64.2]|uniref:VOC family protein n=1 Tax=Acinetobacter sp. CIP 64.2 TaxID=1217694 RepID=UPI0002892BB4|nr:VOC family protein [Acinetobacter sp. CIP 64.2]ENX13281.1 hypothetical protein F895_02585 [Acinetobacter sp. CIP 64.2]